MYIFLLYDMNLNMYVPIKEEDILVEFLLFILFLMITILIMGFF